MNGYICGHVALPMILSFKSILMISWTEFEKEQCACHAGLSWRKCTAAVWAMSCHYNIKDLGVFKIQYFCLPTWREDQSRFFGNVVLCHYNYWNSGSRLVFVVIATFYVTQKGSKERLFILTNKFLCHATDVFECNCGKVLIEPYCWEPENFVYIPVYSFLFLHFQVVNWCLLSHVRCPKRYGLTESV